jgi:hypothetical protein
MSLQTTAALLIAALSLSVQAQTLSDAFNQGATLGRSGNAAGRGQINGNTAQASVPATPPAPPEASYFGSPGLGTLSSAHVSACTAPPGNSGGFAEQGCNAVDFSQTNPVAAADLQHRSQRPAAHRAKTITADPQAIAGNLAGTYSGCSVQTVTRPDIFETLICHQYRTMENTTCDKVLIVTPIQTPGCSPGQFLTRVTADPCPACIDYLAFDFSCGANNYLMHAFTIDKGSGGVYMELGSQYVPGTLNTQIGQSPGPSRIDGYYCYQTYYSQSCSGANCSIGAWFYNPCQGTSYYGVSTFAMPTTVSFTDTWDNQCAALEARAQ